MYHARVGKAQLVAGDVFMQKQPSECEHCWNKRCE